MQPRSKFGNLIDTSNGAAPGMPEALETLTSEYWKAREAQQPAGRLALLKRALKEEMNTYLLPIMEEVKDGIKITAQDPMVLVAALPFVEKLRIDRALETLSKIPEGAALVDRARERGTKIALKRMSGARFYAEVEDIALGGEIKSSGLDMQRFSTHGMMVAMAAHELQHLNQAAAGVTFSTRDKIASPLEMVWHDRVIEADAEATSVDICYKLNMIGEGDAWKRLMSGSAFFGSSIAQAYADMAEKDPDSIYDGRAKRAAFDQWFAARHNSGNMLSEVYNRQGINKAGSVHSPRLLGGSTQLEDKPYAPLTAQDIEKIGDLSEVNYLKLPGHRPVNDPYYRKPDWNAYQAGRLTRMQQNYQDSIQSRAPDASKDVKTAPVKAPAPPLRP